MVMFRIPAFCPTCLAVYPSGITVGHGAQTAISGNTIICPNGHLGFIPDGVYTALDELYRYFLSPEGRLVVAKVYAVTQAVAEEEKSADDGLDEIVDLLPSEAGTAVKKLGSHNPLTAILVVLIVLGAVGQHIAGVYKTLSPDAPAPTLTINHNETILSQSASGRGSNQAILEPGARQQRRQEERAREAEQGKPRQAEKEPAAETGSIVQKPRKTKARSARAKDKAARRRALNPRHGVPRPHD